MKYGESLFDICYLVDRKASLINAEKRSGTVVRLFRIFRIEG